MFFSRILTVVFIITCLSVPAQAGEGEIWFDVSPVYSSIPTIEDGVAGLGGGAQLAFGIDTFWTIAIGSTYTYHIPVEEEEQLSLFSAYAGVVYNVDVVSVIPFLSLSACYYQSNRPFFDEGEDDQTFGVKIGLGFDYRRWRNWAIGFELNYHAFVFNLLEYPVYITGLLRLSTIFEL